MGTIDVTPVAGTAPADFEKLTRHHTVECSVEDAALAVGDVVGQKSVKSTLQMNGAIVIFVDSTAEVSELVEKGVVIKDAFTTVSPPPHRFINNESLVKELSQYGQMVSPIRMVSLSCKSLKIKHVVYHSRQVMMILKDKESHLNLSVSLNVDGVIT